MMTFTLSEFLHFLEEEKIISIPWNQKVLRPFSKFFEIGAEKRYSYYVILIVVYSTAFINSDED